MSSACYNIFLCALFFVSKIVQLLTVPNFSGVQLHDACESMGLTRRHLYSLITATREVPGGAAFGVRISGPPLLGNIVLVHTTVDQEKNDDKNGPMGCITQS